MTDRAPVSPSHRERRRRAALLGVTAVAATALLCAPAIILTPWVEQGATAGTAIGSTTVASAAAAAVPIAASRGAVRPVRIDIPAIGVRARIIRLGLNADRTLQVPRNFADTGWWAGGPRPGARGPAVIVGHVDSTRGPAVFYRLSRLRRGDSIRIRLSNGRLVRFAVQRKARYPKARFPTQKVYGDTRSPTLRLITCSGTFDRSAGHYRDNTIVFAALRSRR